MLERIHGFAKVGVAAAGILAAAGSVSANTTTTVLFSTYQDFSVSGAWGGNSGGSTGPVVSTVAAVDSTEGGTVNGVGNNSPTGDVAGDTGTPGALQITFSNGTGNNTGPGSYNVVASGPNISGSYDSTTKVYTPTTAIAAIDNAIAADGVITFSVEEPTNNVYFLAPLLLLNFPGSYDQIQTTLSSTSDTNGFYTATASLKGIANIANAEQTSYESNGYGYFNIGVIFNAGVPVGSTAEITNFAVSSPTPEPASLGLLGVGAAGLFLLGRRRMAK